MFLSVEFCGEADGMCRLWVITFPSANLLPARRLGKQFASVVKDPAARTGDEILLAVIGTQLSDQVGWLISQLELLQPTIQLTNYQTIEPFNYFIPSTLRAMTSR